MPVSHGTGKAGTVGISRWMSWSSMPVRASRRLTGRAVQVLCPVVARPGVSADGAGIGDGEAEHPGGHLGAGVVVV
jgi:hypothetical protein